MKSFILYLFFFILSICLSIPLQSFLDKNTRSYRVKTYWELIIVLLFLLLIVVIPTCYLAAVRSDYVGADTKNYVGMLDIAKQYKTYFSFLRARGNEDILFYLIVYLCSRLSYGRFVFLGTVQLLALFPVAKLALIHKEKYKLWQLLFVYYFWFFADSLNAVRQYIAVGFIALMFVNMENKEYLKAGAIFLLSLGFHSSALIAGAAMVVVYYANYTDNSMYKRFVVFLMCVYVLLFGQNLILFLYDAGVFPSRWSLYINTFIKHSGDAVTRWFYLRIGIVFEVAIRVAILGIMLYKYKKYYKQEESIYKQYSSYLMAYALNIMIYLGGILIYHTEYLVRLSVYFDYFIILILPELDKRGITFRINKRYLPIYTVLASLLYWFIHAVLVNSGRTFPYSIL